MNIPSKENIQSLVQELANNWQPEDYLWLFFSGYGVNHKGKDYLMPVGGDPEQIVETGIEVRSLIQSLEITGIKVLLIFDINRAFGTQADAPVGQEIMKVAAELQMGAIISCQPEEFSHESTELGHGFFTAALLEALGSGKGYDLSDLGSYLSYLTPKLCQYHWRPVQNPITVIPADKPAILPILTLDANSESVIFPEASFAVTRTIPPLEKSPSVATTLNKTPTAVSESIAPISHGEGRFIPPMTTAKDQGSSRSAITLWQEFIIWGGSNIVIVALIATFLLRHHDHFRFENLSKTVFKNTTTTTKFPDLLPNTKNRSIAQINLNTDSKKRSQAILELEKMFLLRHQPRDLVTAIAQARRVKPNTSLYVKAQENIEVWCQMILELAQVQAAQRKYKNAIATAQLITKKEPLYWQAETMIKKWQIEAKQYVSNKTLLDAATALIIPEQASSYNRAIVVAKKIPREQPGFETAQKSINQWSEKILDLAKIRAKQGDFQGAISTAILVPTGAIAYEDAQDAIQKWQLQKN
ncbi:MAG: caspase domain-containing protein [Dolichospermum sp.]